MTDSNTYPIWTAHCGCQITVHPEHGEPVEHVVRCERHQTHQAGDVAAENRAMTIARMAIAAQSGCDIEETVAFINDDGNAYCVSIDGKSAAEVPPLTLDQYLAANPNAISYAKAL